MKSLFVGLLITVITFNAEASCNASGISKAVKDFFERHRVFEQVLGEKKVNIMVQKGAYRLSGEENAYSVLCAYDLVDMKTGNVTHKNCVVKVSEQYCTAGEMHSTVLEKL